MSVLTGSMATLPSCINDEAGDEEDEEGGLPTDEEGEEQEQDGLLTRALRGSTGRGGGQEVRGAG